ncbi:MAG: 50S ribosomal protein L13 [Mycoplasmataceae bacterium]|jgi:large subunit ribosomal protein L13|nr:50S ribosomal protein L13 [Mycoplasmataceae bacterium]
MQKTTMIKKEMMEQKRQWYDIDATGLVLGKLAVVVADLLRGKNKPIFTPHVDCGDFVIVRNASKIVLTKNKADNEYWYNHSGYIGGLRRRSGKEMLAKYADELVYIAVKGMLPKNRLARRIITKLHVYADAGKDHAQQKPIIYKVAK